MKNTKEFIKAVIALIGINFLLWFPYVSVRSGTFIAYKTSFGVRPELLVAGVIAVVVCFIYSLKVIANWKRYFWIAFIVQLILYFSFAGFSIYDDYRFSKDYGMNLKNLQEGQKQICSAYKKNPTELKELADICENQ